jgi:hypothetical protein
MLFHGHPGEGLEVQLYKRHRIATLFGYGLDAEYIAEYMGLPVSVARRVVVEEIDSLVGEGVERDEW